MLGKGKGNPITGLDKPWGFQEFEAPRFQDNRHMKMVRLSAMRCCIPAENVSWMLLSGGAKLEPPSGLGGEGSLL